MVTINGNKFYNYNIKTIFFHQGNHPFSFTLYKNRGESIVFVKIYEFQSWVEKSVLRPSKSKKIGFCSDDCDIVYGAWEYNRVPILMKFGNTY